MVVTIYKNIFSKEPNYIDLEQAIKRIRDGASKKRVDEIRSQLDKDRADQLKQNLPSVCFSGKFGPDRTDGSLIEHSGFVVLDFDDVPKMDVLLEDLINDEYIYAAWTSPSGNGVKALVRIADGNKHREHFQALQERFKGVDGSGINPSRVCYESYDPGICVNEKASVFKKTVEIKKVEVPVKATGSDNFKALLKWLTNKGDAFVEGNRNFFIFKLASASCRFGIPEDECVNSCRESFHDSSFSDGEMVKAVSSAYRSNDFGTAEMTNNRLVDVKSRKEVETKVDPSVYDKSIKPKDVIFGEDVKKEALNILHKGYEDVESTGVLELDEYFKLKRGEITLLSGIGNYGKSTFLKYLLLLKCIKYGRKFALFAPEDNPAEEFYHDLTEMYLGMECTPHNTNGPTDEQYEIAYDFVSKHIFYIYPKEFQPTPKYIKERFLELIIKENVDGCVIDPFNQLTNDYGARSDKYLETFLSDCTRFAQLNNVYFVIVAHPAKMRKNIGETSYPCPDVYDIADGAMWNNKMDNILIYHRPDHQENPMSNVCELHTKKIRRQKTVGKKGVLEFELNRKRRRYIFDNRDYMKDAISVLTGKEENEQKDYMF